MTKTTINLRMKSLILIGVVLFVLIVGVVFVSVINKEKGNSNSNNSEGVVLEFPPLTLCRNTGGNWEEINASEFPMNEKEGVYNPTTNTKINYKCFCPPDKKWDIDRGCAK